MWRPMRIADVEACHRLPLEDEVAYDAQTRALLPDLWRELLTGGNAETTLLEDRDLPPPAPAGVLVRRVPDGRLRRRGEVQPFPLRQPPHHGRLAGRQVPILNTEAIRAANSGPGLNQHTFHQAYPGMMPSPPRRCWKASLTPSSSSAPAIRSKRRPLRSTGRAQLQMNLNGGFRLRNDYGAFFERPGAAIPRSAALPHRPEPRRESRPAPGASCP